DRAAGQADGPRRGDHLGRLGQGVRQDRRPGGRRDHGRQEPRRHGHRPPVGPPRLRRHDTPVPQPDPDRPSPWTTLSRRPVYENRWIAVREAQVIRPDGQPGISGVVHFKHTAVGVLPVDEQGRVWLVGQYRYPLGIYSWEIPEGGGHEGEPPEETARRELRE